MKSIIIIPISIMLLTGCAEKWIKPGATQQEFEAMRSACISRAYSFHPPMNRQVQISSGYTTPITTNCNGFGYSINCYQTGGQYIAPAYITIDDNLSARNQETRTCFFSNGWQPAQQN